MIRLDSFIAAMFLLPAGVASGLLCCVILNRIPAEWLCDYDETPSPELLSGKRYSVKKHGFILGAVIGLTFAAMTITNGVSQQQLISIFMCFALALVAAADAKYTIIPDQFTAAAAFIALDFAIIDCFSQKMILHAWYEPLIGAAVGGGILIALDLFSMAVLKKEGFGFGDVKLLAALGLMFGWKYIFILLIVASLIAAVHFLILIFAGNGKIDEGKYLPMAPYLCMGAVVTLIGLPWFESLFGLYKMVLEMSTLP